MHGFRNINLKKMVVNIFFYWLVAALLISFFNLKAGIGVLLAYILLVPYSTFTDSLFYLELNYIIFSIFLVFLVKMYLGNKENIDLVFFRIFAIYTFVAFVGAVFATDLNFTQQITNLYRFILSNVLLALMLWHICITDSDVNYFIRIIFVCFIFMSIYGFYCFFTESNPYVTVLSILFNKDDNNEVFANTIREGVSGRVQSTTFHAFLWAILLIMMFYVSIAFRKENLKWMLYGVLVILIGNIIIGGVRTGILVLFLGSAFLVFNLFSRTKLYILPIIILFLVLSFDTSIFGPYQGYVDSIIYFADADKNIRGSSLSMRVDQLSGAIELWFKGGVLFGNGFGWCDYYYATKGNHPVVLGFESMIFKVIIDSGFAGILLWSWLLYQLFKLNRTYCYDVTTDARNINYKVIIVFIISYTVFIIATGLFGLNLFLVLLVLMIKHTHFNMLALPKLNQQPSDN